MRQLDDHYDYVAVIVDDLLIFSRDPEFYIKIITEKIGYVLKGVGIPEYYSVRCTAPRARAYLPVQFPL